MHVELAGQPVEIVDRQVLYTPVGRIEAGAAPPFLTALILQRKVSHNVDPELTLKDLAGQPLPRTRRSGQDAALRRSNAGADAPCYGPQNKDEDEERTPQNGDRDPRDGSHQHQAVKEPPRQRIDGG